MKPMLLIGAIGVVALVSGVGYNTLYKPQQKRAESIHAQIEKELLRQRTVTDVAAWFQQLERSRTRLSPEPDPGWLVREVVGIAQQGKAGVQLTSITQDTPQDAGGFTRLAISVKVAASYHSLGTFLDELERAEHFIRVDQFEIHPSSDGHSVPTTDLVLSTMYVPPALPAQGLQ